MKTEHTKTWLWPDRVIGKRESRELREEHNALVNHLYGLHPMQSIAWTGGSGPTAPSGITTMEAAYAKALFRSQCNTFRHYWRTRVIPYDTMRIFWGRARGDAHATFRNAVNQ